MNPLFFRENIDWLLPLAIWTLFWKALALWTSAKQDQKGWFVAILVLNTLGILEIVYFFVISKKEFSDIKAFFSFGKKENPTIK